MQDSLFSENEHRKRNLDKVIHTLGAKGLKLKKASELNDISDISYRGQETPSKDR